MKVKVMKITVVDERGTCDQRNDAAAAAEHAAADEADGADAAAAAAAACMNACTHAV